MLHDHCLTELRTSWFPQTTDSGLLRVLELLQEGSPLLIRGAFTSAIPQGCLASHIAWHHPQTQHLQEDAGIIWLSRCAGLNPATSAVLDIWDRSSEPESDISEFFCHAFAMELARRQTLE